MTVLIVFGDDRATDDYVSSSWWFEFLERHLEPVTGDLRDVLEDNVSVVGVNFTTMEADERSIVAGWLVGALDADLRDEELSGRSRDHLTAVRAKLAALTSAP